MTRPQILRVVRELRRGVTEVLMSSVRPPKELAVPPLVPVFTRVDCANDRAVFWNGRSATIAAYLRAHLNWITAR